MAILPLVAYITRRLLSPSVISANFNFVKFSSGCEFYANLKIQIEILVAIHVSIQVHSSKHLQRTSSTQYKSLLVL